jgi:alkylation response protein AidB-like acyl-CoA dehydrogenase
MRVAFVSQERCRVLDTWDVTGLRGTGSHDFVIDTIDVAERYTMGFPESERYADGPLYRLPATALLGPGVSSVCLGLGRAAIDDLVETATVKRPALSRALLRERASVPLVVAEAEATLQAARLYLFSALEEVWRAGVAKEEVSMAARTGLRLACWNAGQAGLRATDLMFTAGGSSAAYRGSRLERAFRDVHVAVSHVTIGPMAQEAAGRMMLGLEPTVPLI